MAERRGACVAFVGDELVGRGPLAEVVARAKALVDAGEERRIALFDDESGHVVDIDYSGSEREVLARLQPPPTESTTPTRRARGRPRLGVVSREVSLLPRQWEWLGEQRGGASAVLRRLVEEARKNESQDAVQRRAIDAAHRFLWDIAGNQPGFEEATRALFAKNFTRCRRLARGWPRAIREQLDRYLERAR